MNLKNLQKLKKEETKKLNVNVEQKKKKKEKRDEPKLKKRV